VCVCECVFESVCVRVCKPAQVEGGCIAKHQRKMVKQKKC
jgi:hypothetical protein